MTADEKYHIYMCLYTVIHSYKYLQWPAGRSEWPTDDRRPPTHRFCAVARSESLVCGAGIFFLSNKIKVIKRFWTLIGRVFWLDKILLHPTDTSRLTAGLGVILRRRSMSILQNPITVYNKVRTLYNKWIFTYFMSRYFAYFPLSNQIIIITVLCKY